MLSEFSRYIEALLIFVIILNWIAHLQMELEKNLDSY